MQKSINIKFISVGYKFKTDCGKFYWINKCEHPNFTLDLIERIKRCKN